MSIKPSLLSAKECDCGKRPGKRSVKRRVTPVHSVTGTYRGSVFDLKNMKHDVEWVLHQAGDHLSGYYARFSSRFGSLVDDHRKDTTRGAYLYRFECTTKPTIRASKKGARLSFECKLWRVSTNDWSEVSSTVQKAKTLTIEVGKTTRLQLPAIHVGDLELSTRYRSQWFERTSREASVPFQTRLRETREQWWWKLSKQASFRARKEADDMVTLLVKYMTKYPKGVPKSGRSDVIVNLIGNNKVQGLHRFCSSFTGYNLKAPGSLGSTYDVAEQRYARGYIRDKLEYHDHPVYGNMRDALTPFLQSIVLIDPEPVLNWFDVSNVTKTYYAYRWRMVTRDQSALAGMLRSVLPLLVRGAKRSPALLAASAVIPDRIEGTFEVRRYESADPEGFDWKQLPSTWKYDLSMWFKEIAYHHLAQKGSFESIDSGWHPTNTVYSTEKWGATDFEDHGFELGNIWSPGALRQAVPAKPGRMTIEFASRGKSQMAGHARLRKAKTAKKRFEAAYTYLYAWGSLHLTHGPKSKLPGAPPLRPRSYKHKSTQSFAVVFEYSKHKITKAGHQAIQRFCAEHLDLLRQSGSTLALWGHASYEKDEWDKLDLNLSKNRACAVLCAMNDYLGTKAFVIGRNAVIGGYGHAYAKKRYPYPEFAPAQFKARSRRVDVTLDLELLISFYGAGAP